MRSIPLSGTWPLTFLMVDSSDHVTGKTSLAPTVTLSKNGGSFATQAASITEIANGWYKVAGNATNTDTLGDLILHATASGADPCDAVFSVVAYDSFNSATLGLSEISAISSAVSNIQITGSPAYNAPSSYQLTTGTQSSGTYANVDTSNGVYHVHTDVGGALDLYYEYDLRSDEQAVSLIFKGRLSSSNDTCLVEAYNWVSPGWVTLFTLVGSNTTTDVNQSSALVSKYTGTGENAGKVRIRIVNSGTLTSATLSIDQLLVGKTSTSRTVGYAEGAVWVKASGAAGTVEYINGTADNPCPWGNAVTIADSLGLERFRILPDESITLTAECSARSLIGRNWNLELGSQAIHGTYIEGAVVTGEATASSAPTFVDCRFGASTLPPSLLIRAGIGVGSGCFTAASAGQYALIDCYSLVPGSGTPVFVFSGLGTTTGVNIRRWSGGSNITLDGDCTLTMEVLAGGGQTIVTGGGNAEIRGICRAVTVTSSGNSVTQIAAVTGPVTVNGTGGTVRIYGVSGNVTDNTGGNVTIEHHAVSQAVVDEVGTAVAAVSTAAGLEPIVCEIGWPAGVAISNLTLPCRTENNEPAGLYPQAGTWSITFYDETTSALSYSAGAADIASALEGISYIGSSNVSVTGNGAHAFDLEFVNGAGGQNVLLPVANTDFDCGNAVITTLRDGSAEVSAQSAQSSVALYSGSPSSGYFLLKWNDGVDRSQNISYLDDWSTVQYAINNGGHGTTVSASGGPLPNTPVAIDWGTCPIVSVSVEDIDTGVSWTHGITRAYQAYAAPVNELDKITFNPGAAALAVYAAGAKTTLAPTITVADGYYTIDSISGDVTTGRDTCVLELTTPGRRTVQTIVTTRAPKVYAADVSYAGPYYFRAVEHTGAAQLATMSAVNAITTNTARGRAIVPDQIGRPAAGGSDLTYELDLNLYTLQGAMEVPDAAPTVSARNATGTSRNSLLGSTTMTLISTGRYKVSLTLSSAATAEQLLFDFTWAVGGTSFTITDSTWVVDVYAVDFTTADRNDLQSIKSYTSTTYNKLPSGNLLDSTGAQSASYNAIVAYAPLQASSYTAPANADILTIKGYTSTTYDKLPTGNMVDSTAVGSALASTLATTKVTPVDADGVTYVSAMEGIMAVMFGETEVTDNVVEFKKRDGATTKVEVEVSPTIPGLRTSSTLS